MQMETEKNLKTVKVRRKWKGPISVQRDPEEATVVKDIGKDPEEEKSDSEPEFVLDIDPSETNPVVEPERKVLLTGEQSATQKNKPQARIFDPALRHIKKPRHTHRELALFLKSNLDTAEKQKLENVSTETTSYSQSTITPIEFLQRIRKPKIAGKRKQFSREYATDSATPTLHRTNTSTNDIVSESRVERRHEYNSIGFPWVTGIVDNSDLRPPPNVEWWDADWMEPLDFSTLDPANLENLSATMKKSTPLVMYGHSAIQDSTRNGNLNPLSIQPIAERAEVLPKTKSERKKERRIRRKEKAEKGRQAIRRGEVEPPAPKLTLKNVQKILQNRKVAQMDPTAQEMLVLEDQARRIEAHEQRNAVRKLSSKERGEKVRLKREADAKINPIRSVFRIDFKNGETGKSLYKIYTNGTQLHACGLVLSVGTMGIVILETGRKPTGKLYTLLTRRMRNEVDAILVFQGPLSASQFRAFERREFSHEVTARIYLRDRQYELAWDSVLNTTQASTPVNSGNIQEDQ